MGGGRTVGDERRKFSVEMSKPLANFNLFIIHFSLDIFQCKKERIASFLICILVKVINSEILQ